MPHADKAFVGFGFGPIQSALFLFEAYQSGRFGSFTVAEIDAALVQAVRDNGGAYTINIAHADRIEQVTVRGVTLLNPTDPADHAKIIDAVAAADEMATALPSVKFFDTGGQASVAATLAAGFAKRDPGHRAILYAAENHNHAAEILSKDIGKHAAAEAMNGLAVLNTVVGKMSGVISDEPTIKSLRLATLTPDTPRAVLVEAFNRILVSSVPWPDYQRGIDVFTEKPDLLPFEEAKLYGHNAIHALIGYLAHQRGLANMAQAANHDDLVAVAREAFIHESGAALVRKHAALGDELFTDAGYSAYAEDLLRRMVNPNLNDLVARVVRDPGRKLGYDDRLYGTMRVALIQGIQPEMMAKGAAAAVRYLCEEKGIAQPTSRDALAGILNDIWSSPADEHADALIDLTWAAMQQ